MKWITAYEAIQKQQVPRVCAVSVRKSVQREPSDINVSTQVLRYTLLAPYAGASVQYVCMHACMRAHAQDFILPSNPGPHLDGEGTALVVNRNIIVA